MKKENRDSLIRTIDALANKRKKGSLCLFKHYSAFEIEDADVLDVMDMIGVDAKLFSFEFSNCKMQPAYFPFMDIIREQFENRNFGENAADFIGKCNVYPLHESIFSFYLETGHASRSEHLIVREIEYEKTRFVTGICNIIREISKEQKLVIILKKIHFAHQSTLELLWELFRMILQNELPNVSVIGSINEKYNGYSYVNKFWTQEIEKNRDKDYFVQCDEVFEEETESISWSFETDKKSLTHDFYMINDMRTMLCVEQAKYYAENIYAVIENDLEHISDKTIVFGTLTYALCCVYAGETKKAYTLCKKVKDIKLGFQDKELQYMFFYTCVLVEMYSKQKEKAKALLDKMSLIAESLGDKQKLIDSQMIEIEIATCCNRDTFLWRKNIEISKRNLDCAEKYNQINHLAYAYLFGFVGEEVSTMRMSSDMNFAKSVYFQKGIEYARQADNLPLQLSGWTKNASIASEFGIIDEIIKNHNESKLILEKLNRPEEEFQINCGMGYSFLLNKRFEMAEEYFSYALLIAFKTKNPSQALEAVYNMAINCITKGDYVNVIKYTENILSNMRRLQIERIRVSNKSKLYGLLCVSYIMLNHIYEAKRYLNMIHALVDPLMEEDPCMDCWHDDFFLCNLSEAMIFSREGNYDRALELFEQIWDLLEQSDNKQMYLYVMFIKEYAGVYRKMGKEKQAREILREGISYSEKVKQEFDCVQLRAMLERRDEEKPKVFKQCFSDETLENVNEITIYDKLHKDLADKEKVIKFFENWVDSLNREFEEEEELVVSAINDVQTTFNIDRLVYIDASNGQPFVRFKDRNNDFSQIQARALYEYVKKHKKRIVLSRFDPSFLANTELLGIFGKNSFASMAIIPFIKNDQVTHIFLLQELRHMNFAENLVIYRENEVNIFATAFQELLQAQARERIRKQLEKSSVTDILTKLNNRQGMKHYTENCFNKKGVSEQPKARQTYTILYMDLDNFKYCNDNYGHDAGDAVLVAFSNILSELVGREDCLVRYGGDEFLMILKGKTTNEGVIVAKSLFDELKKRKGFADVISKATNKIAEIAEENWISCSIGISSGTASSMRGFNMILKKADEALYKVKRTTKHNYHVWKKAD